MTITFGTYIRQLVRFGLATSIALAVVACLCLLAVGGTSAEIDLTLEFGALDGLWFLLLLPLVTTLVLLLLSPLSFRIYQLLARRRKSEIEDSA